MVTTKLNLSMTEPQVRQIYAKQGDTGRVLDITLDQTPEDGTLRILRPDGVEVTSEAVTGGEVESGSSFESLTEADVTELTVGIEPVQDLNGYDKPWVGGAGKNKLNFDRATTTINGVTFTDNGDGTYTVSGTSTAATVLEKQVTLDVAQGTPLILSGCPSGGSTNTYAVDTYGTDIALTRDYGSGGTFTASGLQQVVRIVVFANVTMNNLVFKPMIRLASETDPTFAPYSNICPITGHDEVRVYFGAEQGTADETYTTSLGQTVYGGTLDMVTGVLTVTHGNIASYNGETLPSTWISDRDVYASGTTPTTGAQVVYELATPLTYQLTAQQIKTLVGTNNVWASSGDIVNIKFTYGGLLSELPSDATSIVGKCYCDVEQNGVSSMPFTLNVKKNERQ